MQLIGWQQLHRGSNSWEKPTASGGKMEQMVSDSFAYRKTKSCRQHVSTFWG